MNRKQKADRKRARHQARIARRLEKKKALDVLLASDDETEEDVEGEELEEPVETEGEEKEEQPELVTAELEKSYDSTPAYVDDQIGPTSWEEAEAAEIAELQAMEASRVTYRVQDLVRNILRRPDMETDDKAKAIKSVGDGFKDRMSAVLSDDPEDMQKDLDVLELQALIAQDGRHAGLAEKIGDWISKKKLSARSRESLSDGDFALVAKRGGDTVRKYPIHDKAHVRNALARAAQQIKAGGEGAADARAALPKIRAAAKKFSIGVSEKKELNSIVIEKDDNGDWRWVGRVSNNFRDHHGDIIAKEAHEDYCNWLDRNPDMAPYFMSWHTPGTERSHPVDYWNFDNGFLVMSGKLEENEAASLLKASQATDLGMSVQGFAIRDLQDPQIVRKYRLFEVSDLPLDNAANPFTDFSVLSKEEDVDKLKYLTAIMGSEEKAQAFLKKNEFLQQALQDAGVEQKDRKPEAPAGAPDPNVKVVKQTEAPAVSAIKALSPELIEQISKELHMDELSQWFETANAAIEKVEVLESVVKALQIGSDEKLAEKIRPPAAKFAWARKNRASEADESVVKPEDELAKKMPDTGWLSEATGTHPVQAESVH